MKALALLSLCFLFPVLAFSATIHVPADYSTIQGAVNAALDNDQILVAPGTYTEQVTVAGKTVEIRGSGSSATFIRSPAALAVTFTTSVENRCIVGVIDGGYLDMNRLTVDGMSLGNNNFRFIGTGFRNSGGLLQLVKIINIKEAPLSGVEHGVAVYAFNDDGTDREVKTDYCTFEGYQKAGLALSGMNLTAEVKGCLTRGAGATSTLAQNGIQIGYGATGVVDSCTVEKHIYWGSDQAASGILLYNGSSVDVRACPSIKNNQFGAYYIATDGCFTGNLVTADFQTTGADWFYYGMVATCRNDPGTRSFMGPRPSPFGGEDPGPSGFRAGHTVVVADCSFTSNQKPTGVGVGAWAAQFDEIEVRLMDCDFFGWTDAVEVLDDGTALPAVKIYQCRFHQSTSHALNNLSSGMVDAEYSHWGDPSGPYHATLNPQGLGDPASGLVDFQPWLGGLPNFSADSYLFSISSGASIDLQLLSGTGHAGRVYLILSSLSGSDPGFPLPGGQAFMPLNWDGFTDFALARLNTPLFTNFLGVLNASGNAAASINAPPVSPNKLGKVITLAYLLENDPLWDFASIPVEIEFTP